jgi:hypothetical protein
MMTSRNEIERAEDQVRVHKDDVERQHSRVERLAEDSTVRWLAERFLEASERRLRQSLEWLRDLKNRKPE